MSKYLKRIEAARAEADKVMQAVIDQVRIDLLIPYCNRTKLRFTAGMGSWSFDKANLWKTEQVYWGRCDKLPGRIPSTLYDFLHEDAVTSQNDLGSLMEDYTPPGWIHSTDATVAALQKLGDR